MNGSPSESFKGSRGLRQGDPLSPLIFVLAVEVLTNMFRKAEDMGLLNGFKVCKEGEGIPILPFADDTLIIVGGDLREARIVMNIYMVRSLY